MKIITSYKVKTYGHKRVFKMTVELYRQAVDFLIGVCLNEWDDIAQIERSTDRTMFVERLVHKTKDRPFVKYDFDSPFYKFPNYLRRAAIAKAIMQTGLSRRMVIHLLNRRRVIHSHAFTKGIVLSV